MEVSYELTFRSLVTEFSSLTTFPLSTINTLASKTPIDKKPFLGVLHKRARITDQTIEMLCPFPQGKVRFEIRIDRYFPVQMVVVLVLEKVDGSQTAHVFVET